MMSEFGPKMVVDTGPAGGVKSPGKKKKEKKESRFV